jgi:signal peptide peptidase SppA
MFLPHMASRLYGTPLLLARSKLDIILNVLGERVGWPASVPDAASLAPSGKLARFEPSSVLNLSQDLSSAASGIAVIGIAGSLVRRNIGVDAQSGLMSYLDIAQNLEMAANDPSVSGILLDIDSPGGEAGGVFELAQRIREINVIKPVWALACDSAFSAAYAIACAASRVLVTQTSGLGSIGVIAMHVDQTARDAQQGYRFTAVTAGEFKGDLSPHEALNKGANTRLQAEVDRLYGLFVDHVASMRAMAPQAVRATQAACYFGPESIDIGLADALVRADQVIPEFAAYLSQNRLHRPASHAIGTTASAFSEVLTQAHLPSAIPPLSPTESPTNFPNVSQIANVTPKETPMTQDLQTQSAPAPENLPDATALPVGDTSVDEVEETPADSKPNPATATATASVAAGRAQALEIAELCQLAGQTTRIASFLAQGTSASQVRQALLLSRAQSEEISSLIHPDAAKPIAKTTNDGASALLAAVKKLSGAP